MNVVVDEDSHSPAGLAFADDVGADQHIEFAGVFGHGEVALLGLRREQRQDLLEVVAGPQRCFRGKLAPPVTSAVCRPGVAQCGRELFVEVLSGVGERRKISALRFSGLRVGGLVLDESFGAPVA